MHQVRTLVAVLAVLLLPVVAFSATPEQERLAREIQDLRPATSTDPQAVKDLKWAHWTADQPQCRTWTDMAWIMLNENDCLRLEEGAAAGEIPKALYQFYEAGKSLHVILSNPGQTAQETLEAIAAGFSFFPNVFKCSIKSYLITTMPDGPERRRLIIMVDGIADAKSLIDFVSGLKNFATQGFSAFGQTAGQQGKQAANLTASGVTQSTGWFDGIYKATQQTHFGRMGTMKATLFRARQRLEGCVTRESRELFDGVLKDALDYVRETRVWAIDLEQQAYCEAMAAGGQLSPEIKGRLATNATIERWAVSNYKAIETERQQALTIIDQQDKKIDELVELFNGLDARIEAIWESCEVEDADDLIRDLARLREQPCQQYARATAGFSKNIPEVLDKIRIFHMALREFDPYVSRVESDARDLIAQCRFDEVDDFIRSEFSDFDQRWKPSSISGFRHCWTVPPKPSEWPPPLLEQEAAERKGEVHDLFQDIRTRITRAQELLQECAWIRAREEISAARESWARVACPPESEIVGSSGLTSERIDEVSLQIDDHQATVGPKIEALESARRDLLQSIEEQLFIAEEPQNEQRCSAADRVIEMVDLASSFVSPSECPAYPSEDFDLQIAQARDRARQALDLGLVDFEQLSNRGTTAAANCHLEELDQVLRSFSALPKLCRADPAPTVQNLQDERKRIKDEVDAFRANIGNYEREWGNAREHCDLDELGNVARAIAAWSPNSCARWNLEPPELIRVENLELNTIDRVQSLRALKAEIEAALIAKLRVGEGYVRTLEQMTTADQPHALDAVRRIVTDAEDYISFVRSYSAPDQLPERCYLDDLDMVRELVPQLERLIAQLGSTRDGSTATGGNADQVTVPRLEGRSRRVALSFLGELKLRPALRKGVPTGDPSKVGTVARQSPDPETLVPSQSAVSLWFYEEEASPPDVGPAADTSVIQAPPNAPVINQSYCDSSWPGTLLTMDETTGRYTCICPRGTAWSKVQERCLDLKVGIDNSINGALTGDCSHMPGTLWDSLARTCRCPVGSWDPYQRQCVDTAAKQREKDIENTVKQAGCEYLYSQIQVFRENGDSFSLQMAQNAEREARAKGCDSARIEQAIEKGGEGPPPPSQQQPGHGPPGRMTGQCSGTVTSRPTAGYPGDSFTVTITIDPPGSSLISRVTTDNPLCHTCDATKNGEGRFTRVLHFQGTEGPFQLRFIAFDSSGQERCSGSIGLQVLGRRK